MTLFLKRIILAVIAIALFYSCDKDKPKPSWDVDLLIPLLADSIIVDDLLDGAFFVENPDQSISLVFDEELFEMNIDSLVHLPDTLFHYGMRLSFFPIPDTFQPGDTVLTQKFFLPINLQYGDDYTLLLEKAILKEGNILFEAYNESESDLIVSLGIEGAEHPETGSFYSTQEVKKNELFSQDYNLEDYHLNLSGPNNDTVNMFTYSVALVIPADEPEDVIVYPNDSVALSIFFRDITLDYSRGNFGQANFSFGPESYEFNLFSDIDVANVSFSDAEINFHINNTYGVDVNFNIEEVIGYNTTTGESLTLESPLVGIDLFVDKAVEIEQESGEILPFLASFDFTDSNFPEIFSIQPDQISYKMSLETNVNTDSTNLDNFFYYDHPISVSVDARVNGGLKIDSLFESSRIEWNGEGVELDKIKEGDLKYIFTNAYPFDFSMNLYFEDEDQNIIDTLIYQQFIEGGIIDENGFVSEATKTKLSVPLDDDLKANFHKAKYAKYELLISTTDGSEIMIHADNYMRFQVIGDFIYFLEQ